MSETFPNDHPPVTDLLSRRGSGISRRALPSARVLATAALAAGAIGLAIAARYRARYDFANKVVVITGGSRGLGLVLATPLLAVIMVVVQMVYIEDILGSRNIEVKEKKLNVEPGPTMAAKEESPVEELFARPKHPYTEGLLRSVPKLTSEHVVKNERLETIEGVVPSPTELPPGCHFAPRCPHRMPRCTEGRIPLYQLEGGVEVRCVLYDLAAAVTADKQATDFKNQ